MSVILGIVQFFTSAPAKIKLWLFGTGGLAALLVAFKLYVRKEKKTAVRDFTNREALKDVEIRKNAKKVSAKEQRETDGLSDGDVADRLRRRTRDWERL